VVCSTHGELRLAYRVLVGKPVGIVPFGRSGRRAEDNIKIDLVVELRIILRSGCRAEDNIKI
jgi:hypothetical protein